MCRGHIKYQKFKRQATKTSDKTDGIFALNYFALETPKMWGCEGRRQNRDLCRSIKVLFTQSTREWALLLSAGETQSEDQPTIPPNLSRHGPSDNKKQFATHWALTTTNDSRTSHQLPPPDFPIFPLFTDFPDPIPYYTIPLILLSLACLVQFCHKWQHMAEWFQVAKDPGSHAIKSFCSVNAFSEHRIICDIRSSQWTGQNGCKSKTLDVVCLWEINPFIYLPA